MRTPKIYVETRNDYEVTNDFINVTIQNHYEIKNIYNNRQIAMLIK